MWFRGAKLSLRYRLLLRRANKQNRPIISLFFFRSLKRLVNSFDNGFAAAFRRFFDVAFSVTCAGNLTRIEPCDRNRCIKIGACCGHWFCVISGIRVRAHGFGVRALWLVGLFVLCFLRFCLLWILRLAFCVLSVCWFWLCFLLCSLENHLLLLAEEKLIN